MARHDNIRISIYDIQFSWINRFTYTLRSLVFFFRFILSDNVALYFFKTKIKLFELFYIPPAWFHIEKERDWHSQAKFPHTFVAFENKTKKTRRDKSDSITKSIKIRSVEASKNCTCWFFNSFKRNLFIEKIQGSFEWARWAKELPQILLFLSPWLRQN